jgi:uncharacterized protein (TIGR02611 family)
MEEEDAKKAESGSGPTSQLSVLKAAGQRRLRAVRKLFIGVVGMTVLIIGILMIALPGPAFIIIPLGLAILATEYLWAQRWLRKARALLTRAQGNGVTASENRTFRPTKGSEKDSWE